MGRPTIATINLSALKQNLLHLTTLAGSSKIVAVVKADAYGNGAIEVSQAIENYVDLLAVAFIDEAIVLRQAGIKKRILILQGPHQESDFLMGEQSNIIWMMHSQWQLQAYNAFIAKNLHGCNSKDNNEDAKAWFKFDTGMHRLGLPIQEFENVISDYPLLFNKYSVIVTHLACADEPVQQHAIAQISSFIDKVKDSGLPLCIANSAASARFANARQDYVRLGIAMYGSSPFQASDDPLSLAAVMHVDSEIIALRTIPKGDTVGYGGTWHAPRESVIATVALGYADGYPRHAPTGTPAWCNGQRISLVGRVSMDMLTFDVTDIPEVSIGDAVQLWGDKLPINEVAEHIGTIGYELMTRLSQRVPRRYISAPLSEKLEE